jgi:hypothetical protein
MIVPLRPLPGGCRLLAAGAALFLLAGCESDQPYKQAVAARQHAKPPPLAGKDSFFDGRITAEFQTGAGFGDSGKTDDGSPAERGGGGRHGGGGMHMGGGGGGRHGGGGGGRGGGGQDSEPSVSDTIEQDQINNIRRAAASNGPPVIIHLRLTNNGTQPADVVIADFLSELGNFVVQPEKLALAPGQTVEVEPMTSRLAGEIAQAQITLTLQLDGRSEKKIITLGPMPPPAGAPAAPPPSPDAKP